MVLVGEGSLVFVGGTGVRVGASAVRVGATSVRVGSTLGRRVIVGARVTDVSVCEGIGVGENTELLTSVSVGVRVSAPSGVFVEVLKSVETAWIVNTLSVLRVAVAVPRPVFGMIRSES